MGGTLSSVLFKVMVQMAKGTAYMVIGAKLDDGGFETLCLLRYQFGRTKRPMRISTLRRVLLQKFDEDRFTELLAKWEFDASEYERVTAEQLPEVLRTPFLNAKTSGAILQDFFIERFGAGSCHLEYMRNGERASTHGGRRVSQKERERDRTCNRKEHGKGRVTRWQGNRGNKHSNVLQPREGRTVCERLPTSTNAASLWEEAEHWYHDGEQEDAYAGWLRRRSRL